MFNKKIRRSITNASKTVLSYNKQWCFVDLAGKRRIGEIIGYNGKTTWVRIMQGAKSYITVKRHNKKNHVSRPFKSEEII